MFRRMLNHGLKVDFRSHASKWLKSLIIPLIIIKSIPLIRLEMGSWTKVIWIGGIWQSQTRELLFCGLFQTGTSFCSHAIYSHTFIVILIANYWVICYEYTKFFSFKSQTFCLKRCFPSKQTDRLAAIGERVCNTWSEGE